MLKSEGIKRKELDYNDMTTKRNSKTTISKTRTRYFVAEKDNNDEHSTCFVANQYNIEMKDSYIAETDWKEVDLWVSFIERCVHGLPHI